MKLALGGLSLSGGSATASDPVGPLLSTSPSVSPSTAEENTEVTRTQGAWTARGGGSVSITTSEFRVAGSQVSTGATYTPDADDDGLVLIYFEEATETGGTAPGTSSTSVVVGTVTMEAPAIGDSPIPDQAFQVNSGDQTILGTTVQGAFVGSNLTFSITGTGVTMDPTTNTITISDDALTSGITVIVTATNSGGSQPQQFLYVVGDTPDAMGAPTLTPQALALQVELAAEPNDNNSPITGYDLRWSSNGGSSWTEVTDITDPYVISSLTEVSHLVQTRAKNTYGASDTWSTSATATPLAGPSALFLRPDADDSDGGWTTDTGGTSLYEAIDETTFNDADYVRSPNGPSDDIMRVRLSDPSSTLNESEPVILRYRVGKMGTDTLNMTVRLKEGTTTRATFTHTDIPATPTTHTQTLSSAQKTAITNWNNLFLEFEADGVQSAPTVSSFVVAANGTDITATFSEALDTDNDTATSEWSFDVAGSTVTPATAAIDTATPTQVDFTVSTAIDAGQAVTADYTGTSLRAADYGQAVAAITDRSVTNNSTQGDGADGTARSLVAGTGNGGGLENTSMPGITLPATWAAWIKPQNPADFATFWATTTGAEQFYADNTDTRMNFRTGSGAAIRATDFAQNEWKHVCVRMLANGTVEVQVNNGTTQTVSSGTATTLQSAHTQWLLQDDGADGTWTGKLWGVIFAEGSLNPTDLNYDTANGGQAKAYSGSAIYQLEGRHPTNVGHDSSGNGRAFTQSSGATTNASLDAADLPPGAS